MAQPNSPPTPKPVLPWKMRIFVSLLSAVTDASRRSNGTINRRLLNFFDRKAPPAPNPVDGVKSYDVVVDPTRNLWFRLFEPAAAAVSATALPVVVFFHGGGFSFMSADSVPFHEVCRLFSLSFPAIVVSVNYRLAPEHRCPSQYDDGFDVLKFLDHNGAVLPEVADVSRCFLAGDSAGANLAHHVAIRVCRERLRVVKVIGLVLIQPFFGGEERTESEIRLNRVPVVSVDRTDWQWKVFLPDGSDRDHEAVNVSGPNAVDITGMDYPKTIVFTGGFDPLQDWQRRYYQWLRKSGKEAKLIEYPNGIHAFYIFPDLPETSQLISQVKDFITNQVSSSND